MSRGRINSTTTIRWTPGGNEWPADDDRAVGIGPLADDENPFGPSGPPDDVRLMPFDEAVILAAQIKRRVAADAAARGHAMVRRAPIFALGMEKQFPEDAVRIIDMPKGTPLTAEAYDEFENALRVIRETRAFGDAIGAELSASEKPTVWFEGELDERYFRTAAQLQGYDDLVDQFHWIGVSGT